MSQNVYTFSKSKLIDMKKHYESCLEKNPQGSVFRARTPYAVITAYKSGKVLFQGENPDIEIIKWTTKNKESAKNIGTSKTLALDKVLTGTHIGSDESGTGDYFGPVTAAAVFVTESQISKLKNLGIQDSKLIKDDVILKLSKQIVEMKIPYSLLVLHNEKYNQLQNSGWSQGKMKAMLHHHVINNVINKTNGHTFEGIVIDQFCLPQVYKKYLASESEFIHPQTYFMTKAEHHSVAVATASVIARASFLKEMDKLSTMSGFTLLKGASKKVDQLIAKVIQDKGTTYLKKIAKVHFVNTEKAQNYL